MMESFHEEIAARRRQECERKIRYPTPEKAYRAMVRMERKMGHDFTFYRCVFCGSFHIGHSRYQHWGDKTA